MKTCNKCNIEKEIILFYNDKSTKDGYKSACKDCCIKYKLENKEKIYESNRVYRLNNKEKINESNRVYRLNNKDKKIEYDKKYHIKNSEYKKQYYINNKKQLSEKSKKYRIDNKEYLNEKSKIYYLKNKNEILEYQKQYRIENIDKIKKRQKKYRLINKEISNKRERDRKINNPLYKLIHDIRNLIGISIKNKGYTKKSKTYNILGCTFEEFKFHLESQFTEGMTWDNRGKWHLDHIYPVSRAIDEEHLIRLNHYTNFQPLWAEDNIKKGNKI